MVKKQKNDSTKSHNSQGYEQEMCGSYLNY